MKDNFFDKVYKIVERIPYGKVTTYGTIAKACGIGSSARAVGWAMKAAKGSNLPCHRVLNRNGELTGRHNFSTPFLMKELLESEGVEFIEENRVNLKKHLWLPD